MNRKMNNLIIIVFLLVVATTIIQANQNKEIRYDGKGAGVAKAKAVDEYGGAIYVAGSQYSAGSNYNYVLLAYGSSGSLLWSRSYNGMEDGADEAQALYISNSAKIWVTGSSEYRHEEPYSYCDTLYKDWVTLIYSSNGEGEPQELRYDGPGNSCSKDDDIPYAIAHDPSGNVYITGTSVGLDLDPGCSREKYFTTIKYNSNGQQQWVARFEGTAEEEDVATAIAVDSSGNSYVTGHSWDGAQYSILTLKYDTNGNLLWEKRYTGLSSFVLDTATAIKLDSSGNVYVAGVSEGHGTLLKYDNAGNELWVDRYNRVSNYTAMVIDNDNSIIVAGDVSNDLYNRDYLVIKYSSAGTRLWTKTYDSGAQKEDRISSLDVDTNGNSYITGKSDGTGTGFDYATIKYDSSGNQVWVKRYNGTGNGNDQAISIILGESGTITVTGSSKGLLTESDIVTIQYTSAGTQVWEARYSAPPSAVDLNTTQDIVVDDNGNTYVTGTSEWGQNWLDYVTAKYDPQGNLLWVVPYNGHSNWDDIPSAIDVDSAGNVYVSGKSYDMVTNYDAVTIKYDPDGNQLWMVRYDGPSDPFWGGDAVMDMAVDTAGNVYIVVSSWVTITGVIIKYDTNGNQQWISNLPEILHYWDTVQIVLDQSSNVVVGYWTALVKYTSDGQISWEKTGPYTQALTTDSAGNVYGTGGNAIRTTKYSPSGDLLWATQYGDYFDTGNAITVDKAGNVYVTGHTHDLSSPFWDRDYRTIKFDANGTIQWVKDHNSPSNGDDNSYGLAVDAAQNVFVTGITGKVYGPEQYYDITTIKYNPNGDTMWVERYPGPSERDHFGTAMALDKKGYLYVAGSSFDWNTGFDYVILQYSTGTPILFSHKPVIDDSSSPTHNGMIETDESVSLLGQVDNLGSVDALSVDGFLFSFDPVTISNAYATYPDLAPGSSASCISCYSMFAPSANRPATHWDVRIGEIISCSECSSLLYSFIYHIGNSFIDVAPSNLFYTYIETILHHDISSGCDATHYCPGAYIQRQQMAKIICRAMNAYSNGACANTSCAGIFSDVPASNPFCSDIEALYTIGITSGCQASPLLYCPNTNIQRQALAKYVCLAMNQVEPGSCPLNSCTGLFTDVGPGNPFCTYIEGLRTTNVISGCTASAFCPTNLVTRAQTAKIIVNGFNFHL